MSKLKRVLAPLLSPADGSSDPSSRAPTKRASSHRPLYNATVLRGNESAPQNPKTPYLLELIDITNKTFICSGYSEFFLRLREVPIEISF